MKTTKIIIAIIFGLLSAGNIFAQDKEAKLGISFITVDSVKTIRVNITSEDKPVKDVEIKLFAERLFGLLPIGEPVASDENGNADFAFPTDLPGRDGNINVIAKIEDDENYANVEQQAPVKWGVMKNTEVKRERALWASRERAPIYFIIVSNLIIAGIWGTLLYIVFQIFRIKRISTLNK